MLYGKILTVIKKKCSNKKSAAAQLDVQHFHVFHKLGTNFPGSINSLVPRIGSICNLSIFKKFTIKYFSQNIYFGLSRI